MIQHTPVHKKLLVVPFEPGGLTVNLLSDFLRPGIQMQPLFQAVMKEQTVLPVAVPCATPKKQGKAYVGLKQGFPSRRCRVSGITPVIVPAYPSFFLIVIGGPCGIYLKVKGNDICIGIFLKSFQNRPMIARIKNNVLVGKQEDFPASP